MLSLVEFLTVLIALVNATALLGLLYFLMDRYVCLRDAYRLLRLLRAEELRTYRYIVGWSPFPWFFIPQRLVEFLLAFELEEHYAIKQQKGKCRCWLEYYDSLPDYIWRIIKIALAIPAILTIIVLILDRFLIKELAGFL